MNFLRRWFVSAKTYRKLSENYRTLMDGYKALVERSRDDHLWRRKVYKALRNRCFDSCGQRAYDDSCTTCFMRLTEQREPK